MTKSSVQKPAFRKTEFRKFMFYARIKVVVAFLVVNVLGFLVIPCDHSGFDACHQVGIVPTGLPELSKPARTSPNRRTAQKIERKIQRNLAKKEKQT